MKLFYLSLGGAALCVAASFVGWMMPLFGSVTAIVLSASVFIVYFWSPVLAVSAVMTELAFGGQGWWLALRVGDAEIPVRMLLFGGVIAAWIVAESRSHVVIKSLRELKPSIRFPLTILAVSLLWGMGWGMLRGNSFALVFLDANGWWYWLLLFPLLGAVKGSEGLKAVLNAVSGAGLVTAILTLVLYHIFDHQYVIAETLYHWIRDTLLGEITFIRPGAWRIFMQSQVWLLLIWVWSAVRLIYEQKWRLTEVAILVVSSSALMISFSRSYWVGWVVMVAGFTCVGLIRRIGRIRPILAVVIVSLVGGFLLATIVQRIPPIPAGFPLKERIALEEAGSSRIAQLKPLLRAIARHPIIGSGFGTTVAYTSADPRIVAGTAGGTGEFTTYAFEWGYLDIWLKLGFIGLIGLMGLIGGVMAMLWHVVVGAGFTSVPIGADARPAPTEGVVALTLLLSLTALAAVNIFSPYLNHPLGIGMAALSFVYAQSIYSYRHV